VLRVLLHTMPFATQYERDIHFQKHGHKLNAADAVEYETMADVFMFGAMTMAMRECIQPNRINRLRYNLVNRHFGVARIAPVFLKTFYPVPLHTVTRHGGGLGFFAHQCARINV
jgi:hypothetical protein